MPPQRVIPKLASPPDACEREVGSQGFPAYIIRNVVRYSLLGWPVERIVMKSGVSRSTVYKWQRNLIIHGTPVPHLNGPKRGRPPKLSEAEEDAVLEELLQRGWLYQDELISFVQEDLGISIHRSTISRLIKSRGWSWKKIQRLSLTRSEEARALYKVEISRFPVEDLIFIDESIFNEKTGWRTRGYAPIGTEARYQADVKRGSTWSLLAALSIEGYLPIYGIREGYYNKVDFLEWIGEALCPYRSGLPAGASAAGHWVAVPFILGALRARFGGIAGQSTPRKIR